MRLFSVKTCAFFKSAPFDEIIRETLQSHRAQNDPKFFCHILPQWKGVRAYLNYAPSRTIVIHGFTTERMSEITVDTDSMGVVPLAEYYWNKVGTSEVFFCNRYVVYLFSPAVQHSHPRHRLAGGEGRRQERVDVPDSMSPHYRSAARSHPEDERRNFT